MGTDIQHHIFLSYSRKDLALMQRIRDDLRALGLIIWTDERLEPGTPAWETSIASAIKAAGCIVVILSPESAQSPWVGRELAFAETFDIRIFPILVRGDERTAVPFRLISHQWVDGRGDYQRAFAAISAAVRNYAQHMPLLSTTIPSQPPAVQKPEFVTVEPLWKFETGDEIRGTPAVFENTVFIGSYDGFLYALEWDTGKLRWKYATNSAISSSPVIDTDNKYVLFGSEDYTFYTLDCRSGRIKWSFQTKDRIRSTPRLAHGHVWFGSDDGKVYGLTAINGRYQWSFDCGSPIRSQPYVTNQHVYVGSESGELICLELSGRLRWRTKPQGKAFTASPFVYEQEGILYAASMSGHVYAYDARNGTIVWRQMVSGPVASSPVYHEDKLYFGSMNGNLYAIEADNGREKWKITTAKPITAAPAIVGNVLYIGSTDGIFYAIELRTGKELWRFQNTAPFMGAALSVGNVVLAGSLDSCLYALRSQPSNKTV